MINSTEDLAVLSGAKRSESLRRRGVVMDALRQAKVDATKRGHQDSANLLGIADMALTDEALNAIYAAVAADVGR